MKPCMKPDMKPHMKQAMQPGVDHIRGHTYHGRKGAIRNAFRYSIDYVLFDAEAELRKPSLFSRNQGNLASVRDRDHGGAPGQGTGPAWVRTVFDNYQLPQPARILLLTQPRLLGHVFNPVSFWLCYRDADAAELIAVVAEVSNTFGDRHSYFCHHSDLRPIAPCDRLSASKIFHVSPFQPVEGGYTFRFDIGADRVGVWIDYEQSKGGLIATLTGTRAPLSNSALIWSALRRPFGSRRVLTLIHWQALKLWWKRATFRARPLPPEQTVSRG